MDKTKEYALSDGPPSKAIRANGIIIAQGIIRTIQIANITLVNQFILRSRSTSHHNENKPVVNDWDWELGFVLIFTFIAVEFVIRATLLAKVIPEDLNVTLDYIKRW